MVCEGTMEFRTTGRASKESVVEVYLIRLYIIDRQCLLNKTVIIEIQRLYRIMIILS